MPIQYDEDVALLEDVCIIEEADDLKQWINAHPQGTINLKKCTHLHAAIVLVLLALKPTLSQPSEDSFINSWIVPAISP